MNMTHYGPLFIALCHDRLYKRASPVKLPLRQPHTQHFVFLMLIPKKLSVSRHKVIQRQIIRRRVTTIKIIITTLLGTLA